MKMQHMWRDVKQIKCAAAEMTEQNSIINWPLRLRLLRTTTNGSNSRLHMLTLLLCQIIQNTMDN